MTSLYELEGCLDLVVLSYLCTVPELPPNPLDGLDLSRRSWGVREHALSQDGKMTRGAQFSSARLSLVCKRWHAYIRRPKLAKKLWSRLSLRTVTASNALCSNIALTYGACITSVDLSNQRFLSDASIHSVLTSCTSLRSLSARRCPKLKGTAFEMEGLAKVRIYEERKTRVGARGATSYEALTTFTGHGQTS